MFRNHRICQEYNDSTMVNEVVLLVKDISQFINIDDFEKRENEQGNRVDFNNRFLVEYEEIHPCGKGIVQEILEQYRSSL